MRKLALLTVALLPLLGGCVSSTPMEPVPGTATIYWRFQSWDNQIAGDFTSANSGCSQAGVQEVDVEVWDARDTSVSWQSYSCQASNGVPGVVVDLLPGSYTYEAVAYRGHNHDTAVPVFSATGSFTVASGLDTPSDATLDVILSQPLLVLYSKNGVVTCGGVAGVNYSVSDAVGLVEAGTSFCNAYNELPVLTASVVGTTYTVDYLQLLDAGGYSTYERCLVPVLHNGFPPIIDLPPTSTPGCF